MPTTTTTLHDFTVATSGGAPKSLGDFAGQVVLVVNTASKCGLTPQFEGLQRLYDQYAEQGLVVLGFPCNQFANQEPGTAAEAEEFCSLNYGVTFPMFAKVDVNGSDADPLFVWLRSQQGGLLSDAIKWNFTKFLVGRDGRVIARYSPTTEPEKLAKDVEAALAG
ncbi:MAG TPA: glutathione peroxidase [Nocardioides sp.]|uniref:glutathione peroxidase n=1 Tax=Nocardioides sp. TaxID=35761 RepID=UPI002B529665|nr:glutathione peroxidase [Nocardioides sp.]HQR26976.1 glutathione peroxidase [Nocardioides sp.]